MRTWIRFACAPLAGALLALAGFGAQAADKLENIPLEWAPTSPMSERPPVDVSGIETLRLLVEPFTDSRENPDLIGRNISRDVIRKVSTREDVPRFVTYRVKTLLSGLGLNVVETDGAVVMKGEVRKFFAEEARRYNATVALRVTLSDPAGKVLWMVETVGTSSRYGIGYKAANYYEVFSDALIGAVHEMVSNPNFKKVMAAAK